MKARKRFHYYALVVIILIFLFSAWMIWMAPASECSRRLGINVSRKTITEVFEADYGTVYFLQLSTADSAMISNKFNVNLVDKISAKFIPELKNRTAIGKIYRCYRITDNEDDSVCNIVLFTDSKICVVMVTKN